MAHWFPPLIHKVSLPPNHSFIASSWGLGGMIWKGSGVHIMAWIETIKCMGHLFLLVLFSLIGSNVFYTYGFFLFSMCIRLDPFIISTIICELHLWMDYIHIHCVHTTMTSYTLNFLDFSWWSITNVVMLMEFTTIKSHCRVRKSCEMWHPTTHNQFPPFTRLSLCM